jgi:hypothetical protein
MFRRIHKLQRWDGRGLRDTRNLGWIEFRRVGDWALTLASHQPFSRMSMSPMHQCAQVSLVEGRMAMMTPGYAGPEGCRCCIAYIPCRLDREVRFWPCDGFVLAEPGTGSA